MHADFRLELAATAAVINCCECGHVAIWNEESKNTNWYVYMAGLICPTHKTHSKAGLQCKMLLRYIYIICS